MCYRNVSFLSVSLLSYCDLHTSPGTTNLEGEQKQQQPLQFGLTMFLCPSVAAYVSDVWDNEAPLCQPAHQHEKEGGQGRALRAEGVRKLNSNSVHSFRDNSL